MGDTLALAGVAAPAPSAALPSPPLPVAVAVSAVQNGAAPATQAASPDLFALVTEIVADKTGYPPEMLESDTDLESDLGIDSIKRVEILSSVSDQRPEFAKLDTGVLAELRTLGDVVDYLASSLTGDAVSSPEPVASIDANNNFYALIINVIADKTGYPPEMLESDTDLESDLGIDSIKRVEILSSVSEQRPDLGTLDTAVLADLRTIGDVAEYLRNRQGDPTPAVAPTAMSSGLPVVGRYVLQRIEQPAIGMAMPGLTGMILVSEGDLQVDVIAALSQAGMTAAALNLTQIPEGSTGLVLLGSGSHRDDFAVAQAVVPQLASGVVVTVQCTGGTFGNADLSAAWNGGLAGLTRTINQEFPELTVKAIDLDRIDGGVAIVNEILLGGPELNVGLAADGRRIVLSDHELLATPGTVVLTDGDLVVASGGARGVTAATLVELAGTAHLNFLLLGRTALVEEPACCHGISDDAGLKSALLAETKQTGTKLTPVELGKTVSTILAGREIRATLEAMAKQGSQAQYVPVDVTSLNSVQQALDAARRDFGPIRALVHGAGVIADKALVDKTAEQFDRVFDTKVSGLQALLAATSEDPLKVIAMFSSVAARTGNVGQCDYAMANEVLNKVAVAEAARRPDCVVKSFGWGPWEGGMVSPALAARFAELGVPMIPIDVGARMFVQELTEEAPQEIELVIGGKPTDGPLLGDSRRTATMEIVVGPDSHPQLLDHAIDGVPVVPVVMTVEWFVRASRAFAPGKVVQRLLNLEVVRGIMLEQEVKLSLTVEELDDNQVGLSISLDGSLRYRCVAELADDFATSPAPQAPADLEPWGDAEFYDPRVLFHGPSFQVISSVEGLGDSGLTATLRPLAAMGWPEGPWRTDPSTLDGGLQAAVLWNDHTLGSASLPTRIDEVRLFADGPSATEIVCQVTAKGSQVPKVMADISFSSGGVVTTEFVGLETHLRSAATSPA